MAWKPFMTKSSRVLRFGPHTALALLLTTLCCWLAVIDATVNADDWPAGANWTDQYKDDALAVQGYTHGCKIRGGSVRLPEVPFTPASAQVLRSASGLSSDEEPAAMVLQIFKHAR